MEMTELEERMLNRIEKQVAGWKYTRWMLLVISIAMFFQYHLTQELAMLMVAAVGVTYSIINWAGNPAAILLLKVVESKRHNDSPDT